MSGVGWAQHPYFNMVLLLIGTAALAAGTGEIGWHLAIRYAKGAPSPETDRWNLLTKAQRKEIHKLLLASEYPQILGQVVIVNEATVDAQALAYDLRYSLTQGKWKAINVDHPESSKLEPDIWILASATDPRLPILKKIFRIAGLNQTVQLIPRKPEEFPLTVNIGHRQE